ncbi:unnamed protein product, partial [Prorocentrum cordatum]
GDKRRREPLILDLCPTAARRSLPIAATRRPSTRTCTGGCTPTRRGGRSWRSRSRWTARRTPSGPTSGPRAMNSSSSWPRDWCPGRSA